jgi:hypothetical protein
MRGKREGATLFSKKALNPFASPKRSYSVIENERFGLVFKKTRVYKFGHR